MTDIPITFTPPMVCALLDGRKTMTRRLPRVERKNIVRIDDGRRSNVAPLAELPWQNVRRGDRLRVCESLTRADGRVQYVADRTLSGSEWPQSWKQDPRAAVHMPRNLTRLMLIVRSTRIERLQDVSEDDAKAEGLRHIEDDEGGFWRVPGTHVDCWRGSAVESFRQLWCSIRGEREWIANPEVVEIEFDVVRPNA